MSLFGITKHPFHNNKVLNFPKREVSPLIQISRDIPPEPEAKKPVTGGLLAAHDDSSIFTGSQQIAPHHAEDIVMGNGIETLGPRTIQVLSDILINPGVGLNDVVGREIADKLKDDIMMVASHELPPIMLNGFNQALDSLNHGGFLIDEFKQELFDNLMKSGASGLTEFHVKLINENENYSRRFF